MWFFILFLFVMLITSVVLYNVFCVYSIALEKEDLNECPPHSWIPSGEGLICVECGHRPGDDNDRK